MVDAEVSITNYTLYRADREGRSHGGTCIYVRNDLAATMLLAHSNSVCETLVVKVKTLDMVVVSIYRPPDSSTEKFREAMTLCQDTITDTLESNPKIQDILQLGDYNFPFITWPSRKIYQQTRERKAEEKEQAELLMGYMEENFMDNYCLVATRGANTLDLVLTNNSTLVGPVNAVVSSHISDHSMLEMTLNHPHTEPKEAQVKEKPYSTTLHMYDIMKADEEDWLRYETLMVEEEGKFEETSKGETVEKMIEQLYTAIENTVKVVFPKKELKKKKGNMIPKEARLLMKQIKEISSRIQKSQSWKKTYNFTEKLRRKEEELSDLYKKKKIKEENDAIGKIKKDPKYFFCYAKKASKGKSQIGTLIAKNGEEQKVLRSSTNLYFQVQIRNMKSLIQTNSLTSERLHPALLLQPPTMGWRWC